MSEPLAVLVVEDDPDAAALIQSLLERDFEDLAVEHASDIDGALERLLGPDEPIDVVVLDLGLPDAIGGSPLHALKSMLAVPTAPPVVVVTASMAVLGPEALAEGAQDYVTKDTLAEPRVLARAVSFAVQRHRRSVSLAKERVRLLRANAQLQHFASSTAHDLKGPVATALMSLVSARRAVELDRPEVGREFVDRAEAILRRVTDQIDLLLADVQHANAGDLAVVDLHEQIDAVLDVLWAADRLTVERRIKVPLVSRVGGVRQILQNLFENALVHNPDRHVHVRVSTRTVAPFVCLVVEDDGVGIDEVDADHLMRSGVSGPQSSGTGLGLATVVLTAQALGGTVTIDRSPDLGGLRAQIALAERVEAPRDIAPDARPVSPEGRGVPQ